MDGDDAALKAQELKRVVREALIVAAIGLAFSLLANLASPRGLALTRNYFPGNKAAHGQIPVNSHSTTNTTAPSTNAADPTWETVAAHLKEKGLQPVDGQEAARLFQDPQYQMELIVFVDARDDRHYTEGHIPGAYQFDRYYPEKHLLSVLSACRNATKVVVYCSGGHCEDSEFAALTLKDAGVPLERIAVYAGGMTEWAAKGLVVETGARNSGNKRPATP